MEVGTALKLAAVVGVVYVAYRLKQGATSLFGAIPPVIKDGAQAAWQLGSYGAHIITDPLDAFGIVPDTDAQGNPNWVPTTPWEQPQFNSYHDPVYGDYWGAVDPVSNNADGINFNYF